MRTTTIAVILGLAGSAAVLSAAPVAASVPGHADEPALLAGPRVEAADRRVSLVKIGADGTLAALEDREEIAAVDLLRLTPKERDPIDRLVRLRVSEVMSGGLGKIPLLLELQEAIASGEDEKVDEVLTRFGTTRPTWANPKALDEIIEGALPERERGKYRAMVDEYRAAWLNEKRGMMRDGASDAALLAKLEREKKLADIRRPTDAALVQSRERFEKIGRRLELTSEQEGRIQTLIQEYATGTNFSPKPRDGLKLLGDLFGVLTWKQRAEMVRYLREENPKPRWRPLRDSPQGTLMAAGVPVMLIAGRRRRR